MVEHGCESTTSGAPPAYVIGAAHRRASGGVVVCEPVDADYLKNSSAKLGLELALAVIDPGNDHKLVGQTQEFPGGAVGAAKRDEHDDRRRRATAPGRCSASSRGSSRDASARSGCSPRST